tara:strand:- start:349 stop:840 length:492 start_codon:yes stop_codon:yes gene_type:complete
LIHITNIEDKIKSFYKDLIHECTQQRPKSIKNGNNYFLDTKYKNQLYDIVLNESRSRLKKFYLKDNNFQCWCYFSDKKYNQTGWHNHISTSTINAVIYLKIPKNNKGINFDINNKIKNFRPKNFDLYIFPNYLEHYPYPSRNGSRITLNLEIKCNESAKYIFS